MIIKGGEGSGRKTFANLYIKEKYHQTDIRTKYETIAIKNGSKTIDLQMLYDDYHYQIDPSVHGVYDRIIMQGFVKDILQNKPISKTPYHIVIVNNADHLTFEAQQSLRRTLEKNINNCRFIFIVNQESNMIDPIVSRCIQIRLASPEQRDIVNVLKKICIQEQILHHIHQLEQLAAYSRRNLLKAMNLLQYVHLTTPHILTKSSMINMDEINSTDKYIANVAEQLILTKNPAELLGLRDAVYDLLVQCIEPIKILKGIFYVVFEHLGKISQNDDKKYQLVELLAKCENTLKQGSKPIYHIESFCIGVVIILTT
jgi:replication factor C subunit 3/5